MTMKRSKIIIIAIMIILIVICSGLWLFSELKLKNTGGLKIMNQSVHIYPNTWEERKNVTKDLPDSLKNEMDNLIIFGKFGVSKWGVDLDNQQLIIHAYNIQDKKEIDLLQNKKIGNWTIYVIHDTEIEDEIKEVYAELKQIENNSELKVAGVEMLPADKKIIMHVSSSTPDNQNLNGTQIKGWLIEVILAGRLHPTIINSTKLSH